MLKRTIATILFIFLVIPIVSASCENPIGVFKLNEDVDLSIPVRENGAVSSTLKVNITVKNPEGVSIVNFDRMVYDPATEEYNYTVLSGEIDKTGCYVMTVTATNTTSHETASFDFEVTPSGNKSMIGFNFLIIGLAYGAVIFGIWKRDVTITLLGNFGLYFVGLYILFNGIDIIRNDLTLAFSVVTLGIGFYISGKVAMEYLT